jgi:hypothetical protein
MESVFTVPDIQVYRHTGFGFDFDFGLACGAGIVGLLRFAALCRILSPTSRSLT